MSILFLPALLTRGAAELALVDRLATDADLTHDLSHIWLYKSALFESLSVL